jgi:hypothetical protein
MMSSPRKLQPAAILKPLIADFFKNDQSFCKSNDKKTRQQTDLLNLLNSPCNLGVASGKDFEEALNRLQSWPYIFISCLLWCGAQVECSLVRYVVEKRGVSAIDILTKAEFRNDSGENTVHVAVKHGRDDVVDYLLTPWARDPVRTPSSRDDCRLKVLSSYR